MTSNLTYDMGQENSLHKLVNLVQTEHISKEGFSKRYGHFPLK